MLSIKNLSVRLSQAADTEIVRGVSLTVPDGELHALLGPNGSGKSTLAAALAGHPDYLVEGEASVQGQPLLQLPPEERAKIGLFLSWQNPLALPGVKVSTFIRTALNAQAAARRQPPVETAETLRRLRAALADVGLDSSFASRAVGEGFSGGERKRFELATARLLDPRVLILDEIDSGLDIDGLKQIAAIINDLRRRGAAVLVITHSRRLLDLLTPDRVHLFRDGSITESGSLELVERIEERGWQASSS